MKKLIRASIRNDRSPITELTEDEIQGLPDKITLVTSVPGISQYVPKFQIVNKEKLHDPDECLIIDSYWGYAYGRDIYIATEEEITEYYKKQIQQLETTSNNYKRYAL